MTADDLRARPARSDHGELPHIDLSPEERDALADLIDAVGEYRAAMTNVPPSGRGKVWQQTAARQRVYSALAALEADQ